MKDDVKTDFILARSETDAKCAVIQTDFEGLMSRQKQRHERMGKPELKTVMCTPSDPFAGDGQCR